MFAVYTTELIESRKRRMPWRTVMELAKAWKGIVFDGGDCSSARLGDCSIDGVTVVHVERPFSVGTAEALVAEMRERGVTRLFYPIGPGRDYGALQAACDSAKIELVWYMSSSWNSVPRVLRAWKWMGFRAVKPYLVQALIPKRWWIRRLNRTAVRPLIAMSAFTARAMVAAGYPADRVHPILPGLDPLPSRPTIGQSEQSNNLTIPYFLFFGPPQPIRGIYVILEAVRRLARKRRDFRFIPLVRADENAKDALETLKAAINQIKTPIIQPVYGLAKPGEIDAYIEGATAILKPFVLVPSEIPLAPMEAMQRGKLVIGFDGDGTGELIAERGVAVKHCDVDALVDAMERCLNEPSSAKRSHNQWMTWAEVAKKWSSVRV